MPTYTFYNNRTGKQFDEMMKISEREDYLKNNPHVAQVITAPSIVSGVSTSSQNKVPEGFKEVLSKVAEAHPESATGKRYGRKSMKQVKTKQIVDKHLGKF
jgi:predicted RND superfamily exporter protein